MEHIQMAHNGRLVVPAPLRHAIGLPKGGKLVARVTEDGALVLEPFDTAVARMRHMVRARMGTDQTHVVEEFLTDRQAAAGAEGRD